MPVAIAPIDRHLRATRSQLGIEQSNQLAHLPIDGTDAAKMVVMFGDFEHALARDIASAQHIFKERNDVSWLLRPAECDQKERVVSRHSATRPSTWHLFSMPAPDARLQTAQERGGRLLAGSPAACDLRCPLA